MPSTRTAKAARLRHAAFHCRSWRTLVLWRNILELIENLILAERSFRSDILKWKLISVGAIGSIGLGFQDGLKDSATWALCALPWFCVYADLLYRASCIRRDVARQFILKHPEESPVVANLRCYFKHEYKWQRRFGHFSLDAGALIISTITVCSLIVLYSLLTLSAHSALRNSLLLSGTLGVACAIAVEFFIYRRQHRLIHAG